MALFQKTHINIYTVGSQEKPAFILTCSYKQLWKIRMQFGHMQRGGSDWLTAH